MTDDPRIPVLRRVVHTDDLPVEVEAEYRVKVWHDVIGAYSDSQRPDDSTVEVCWRFTGGQDGTLRICEMIPVDEHEVK